MNIPEPKNVLQVEFPFPHDDDETFNDCLYDCLNDEWFENEIKNLVASDYWKIYITDWDVDYDNECVTFTFTHIHLPLADSIAVDWNRIMAKVKKRVDGMVAEMVAEDEWDDDPNGEYWDARGVTKPEPKVVNDNQWSSDMATSKNDDTWGIWSKG